MNVENKAYQPPILGDTIPMSRFEVFAHTIIRFKYSRKAIIIYTTITVLSIVSVIWSIFEVCPSGLFTLFELLINGLLICDVIIALIAFQKVKLLSIFNLKLKMYM
jgi:hypothetical protein